jgi:hypothetical protein
VFKTTQATKEKVGQIKDRATLSLGALNEKPHKDDEARKYEAQEEYDLMLG